MSVDKIILRAFLSTLAAIAVLLTFMIFALCIVFPSTMMGITYNLGMENSSIHFAERAYKSHEDIYFISYATEVAIEEGKREKIISCGQEFITDEEFEAFCKRKGDSYGQFIVGQVCVAKYEAGNKDEAITDAFASLKGGFPENNAVVSVFLTAMNNNDKDTVSKVLDKLNILTVEGEQSYLGEMIALGNGFLTK